MVVVEMMVSIKLIPKGYIFDLMRYAIHDGPGIRITVFLQGCPLQCWWCHNPEGLRTIPDMDVGDSSPQNRFKPHRVITVPELIREIEKEILFFDESGGGVTFSGGEPLLQHRFLKASLEECRRRGIHTVLDTSGYASPEILLAILDYVDRFHYDLKLLDDEKHRFYTGVSNQPILSNLKTLVDRGKDVVIRFPLIPGITDTEENLDQLLALIRSLPPIHTIHVLPYHRSAREKYRRLQLEEKLKGIYPPSAEAVEAVTIRFKNAGFHVHVGG